MLVIAIIALIFIGPDQIPEVARTLGRLLNDVRRSTEDLKREFQDKAGLPRNLDEWVSTPRIAPPRIESSGQEGDEHADPHEGLDHESLGHAPSVEEGGTSAVEPVQMDLGDATELTKIAPKNVGEAFGETLVDQMADTKDPKKHES